MPIDQRLVELWESSGARARGTPLAEFRTDKKEIGSNCTIGFCTAIKGPERFPLLLESLDSNIALYKKIWRREHYKPRVHFVVLSYGEPELEAFMLKHFKEEIKEGIITFATVESKYWEFSAAKNTAARIAIDYLHCNVVCNLDGDNILGKGGKLEYGTEDIPDFITFLQQTFKHGGNAIVRPMSDKEGELGLPLMRGIGGRIAMSRETFWSIRGYDEKKFRGWGGNDRDIMLRALALFRQGHYTPLRFVPVSDPRIAGEVLNHESEYRWKNLSPKLRTATEAIESSSAKLWEHPEERTLFLANELAALLINPHQDLNLHVNPNGWKHDTVKIANYDIRKQVFDYENFDLRPLPPLEPWQLKKLQTKPTTEIKAPEWQKESVAKNLDGIPAFYKKAILYAASRRQKFEGREPLEWALSRILGQVRAPEEMKRIVDEYNQFLSNCEQYGIAAHPEKPEKNEPAKNPPSFAQRYVNSRQGKGSQIAK